jgi:hypothetical protein
MHLSCRNAAFGYGPHWVVRLIGSRRRGHRLHPANSGRSLGEIQRQLPDGESRPSANPGPHRCLKVQILEPPQRSRSSSAAAHGVSSLRRYLHRRVDPVGRSLPRRMRREIDLRELRQISGPDRICERLLMATFCV